MRHVINNTPSGSGLGDNLHISFGKVNDMTEEIYGILGTLSGSLAKTKTSEFTNDGEDGTHPFLTTEDSIAIGSVTGLQTSLNQLESEIETVSGSLASVNQSISTLQSNENTINNTLTSILATLTSQQSQITAIQEDIAQIYSIINA